MRTHEVIPALALLLAAQTVAAQTPFTDAFPPEEFAARRTRLMEQISPDALVAIRGAGETPIYVRFRQNNQFFYLTGVQVPNARLLFSIEFGLSLNIPEEPALARLEDNYVVTETGVENLTSSLPRELEEIERIMAEPSAFRPRGSGTQ